MPVTPTYPGVYIEELPSGVRTIVGVATSIGAFVDFFARGPMDYPVQIFNFGDFEREFGGLHRLSEASYAIQQFFLNGGSNAYVVRTAEAGTYATATITLQDGSGTGVLTATAGRRLQGAAVDNPGAWANNVRLDVDYDTTDPSSLFNLTVVEVAFQDGRQVVVQDETYRNLSMDPNHSDYAVEVVNEGSRLIQLTRLTPTSDTTTRPAPTGTWSTDATGAEAALTSGETFDVHYGGSTATATVTFSTAPANLQQVRAILQSAIRAADPNEPLLAGATVSLIGTQFLVRAGRTGQNFDAETILTFTDNSGTPATDLGLIAPIANVQQYSLGSATSVGAQGAGTTGADGDPPTATELRGSLAAKTGIYALEDADLFNILCLPRAAELDATSMSQVYSEAQSYCESRRAFMIVDLPANIDTLDEARDWLDQNATLRHQNAAAYFPRPRIPDPLNNYRLKAVGASGTVAGLYARTDANRGVWKAPAGIEGNLRNVPDLTYKLTDAENGQLNPLGLNCLRNFDVYGNVCWGARTLVGADQQASDWKYIPVRRIALFIEESLYRGSQWVVFEPNDEPLWAQIRLNVGAFMNGLFRQGAFQGSTPREAYLVKCDKETTTQADINRGVVNILVGFAPLKPAEFVIIKIQQLAGQIET
ncbi:MAG TPA: phage tail sheath family protein [Gammaproteobacteria bacterium]|nr:phage tail sheath family protein [Gammaproteobacteria bacterium]